MVDKFTEARVRIAAMQASILKSGYDEGKHPRDNHGRWSAGDSVQFTAHGSPPGADKIKGTIVGSNERDMTHAVEDDNGTVHHVPTENLEPAGSASPFTLGGNDESSPIGNAAAYIQTLNNKDLLAVTNSKIDHPALAKAALGLHANAPGVAYSQHEGTWNAATKMHSLMGRMSDTAKQQIASGAVDVPHLLRSEAAARGIDKTGKWVGFGAAAKHWGF